MAIKTTHETFDKTWFITFTCFRWIPLFEITNSYPLLYKWLNFIKEKKSIETTAFVFMPNHVHLILHLNKPENLNKIIANGKRFLAYEIIKKLKSQHNDNLLYILNEGCSKAERKKGQLHKVFESSFDAKAILNHQFLFQKLDYIHHNPVVKKWNLAPYFVDYEHSSAAFYETNKEHASISITHYLDLHG